MIQPIEGSQPASSPQQPEDPSQSDIDNINRLLGGSMSDVDKAEQMIGDMIPKIFGSNPKIS